MTLTTKQANARRLLATKYKIDHEPVTKESTVGDDREPTIYSSPTSEWIRIEAAKLPLFEVDWHVFPDLSPQLDINAFFEVLSDGN